MTRTVTALFASQAEAARARDSLRAVNLGDDVAIHDAGEKTAEAPHGLLGRLAQMFGGHHDHHVYGEGVRRGHVLLTARVDELDETRAAEILDAADPIDLDKAQETWREEGWTPPPASGLASATGADTEAAPAFAETPRTLGGSAVRSYPPADEAGWIGGAEARDRTLGDD